ncbi:SIMPL domain-containing protein [Sphingobacterium sp. SRCM116780]|uniref:SIMPL domain-containing protein n=1 Tax=Sphingobacterium sp. SRCM116780 TaxID=2907623 RepID=UPI001F295322|nr:SIMPL domain-containing protein [Sphingobacterium sp. SRCM116780]UIR55705.1 SIMPL domain-containing protein [Sphingobacterium sp. SRCM116780]
MMKNLVLGILLLAATHTTQAQQMIQKDMVSTIGRAEEEVTPDIIYIQVTLKEFYQDGNTKKKVTIENLEKQLFQSATNIGVEKKDFTIQNIYSTNYTTKKKKETDILLSRQYRIKVTQLNKLNDLFDGVDAAGIENTSISELDYSKKKELLKSLKVKAVQDALENAKILAEAANQKVGKAILLSESPQMLYFDSPRAMAYKTVSLESADAAGASPDLDLSIKSIKITSEVNASFEIL